MSNDNLKIKQSVKKPELKNWQKRHLANYDALVKTNNMKKENANLQLKRHKIPENYWFK